MKSERCSYLRRQSSVTQHRFGDFGLNSSITAVPARCGSAPRSSQKAEQSSRRHAAPRAPPANGRQQTERPAAAARAHARHEEQRAAVPTTPSSALPASGPPPPPPALGSRPAPAHPLRPRLGAAPRGGAGEGRPSGGPTRCSLEGTARAASRKRLSHNAAKFSSVLFSTVTVFK